MGWMLVVFVLPVVVHQRLSAFEGREERWDMGRVVRCGGQWKDGHEGGPVEDKIVVVLNFRVEAVLHLLGGVLDGLDDFAVFA